MSVIILDVYFLVPKLPLGCCLWRSSVSAGHRQNLDVPVGKVDPKMDRAIRRDVDLHLTADTVALDRIAVSFWRGTPLVELFEQLPALPFWHGIEDGDNFQINRPAVLHAGG